MCWYLPGYSGRCVSARVSVRVSSVGGCYRSLYDKYDTLLSLSIRVL